MSTLHAEWPLQDAKNRLSELVNQAVEKGPQTITRRGKPAAIVLSVEYFRRLTASREDLVTFFRKSPLLGVELDIERSDDTGRDVAL